MIMPLVLVGLIAITNCGPHARIVDFLRDKYQEVIISSAIDYSGGLIEEAVNKETGTWSILLTMSRQATCIVASGTGWRTVVPREILGEEDA